MQTCQANWEDEENNRIVTLAVQYTASAGEVQLRDVTPTKVTFLNDAKAEQRTIRVHTHTGASLLRKQWRRRGGVERLEHQLTQALLAGSR